MLQVLLMMHLEEKDWKFLIEKNLLNEMSKLESKLEYRGKFTNESSLIKNIEARLEQLKPMLLDYQMKAVDTALAFNESKLLNAQDRKLN